MFRTTDVQFMQDPDKWQRWPFLPLTRYDAEARSTLTGVLVEMQGGFGFAEGVNLFASKLTDARFEPCDPQALYDAGWRVD